MNMSSSPSHGKFKPNRIGERIASLRKQQRLTQQELGQKLLRTGSNVSQLENGHVRDSPEDLAFLAQILKAHPLYLIAGLSPECCEIIDALKGMPVESRATATRIFRAALEFADATSAWNKPPAK
jgi:transcriptional regulator with XRE-family HTH domain